MFRKPVLWSDKNQITGDTIHLISDQKTEKLDSLKVLNNAFIVSKDSLSENDFNQIKGRNMYGKFKDNKLRLLFVKGNAESVYYNRNEETNVLETITKEISSTIEFTLDNGIIASIKYIKKSDGKTFPPSKLPEDVKQLQGFIWREDEQPKKMQDIFIKNSAEIERKDNKKSNLIEKVKDAKDIKGIELETKNNSAKQLTKKSEEKLTISSKKQ
jgi:hypothetical protein